MTFADTAFLVLVALLGSHGRVQDAVAARAADHERTVALQLEWEEGQRAAAEAWEAEQRARAEAERVAAEAERATVETERRIRAEQLADLAHLQTVARRALAVSQRVGDAAAEALRWVSPRRIEKASHALQLEYGCGWVRPERIPY